MGFATIQVAHQNLQERAFSRLLLQFRGSSVLKNLLDAIVKEVQELQNSAEQVIAGRTAAEAVGEQLDALGRIVGQPREGVTYSESIWFAPDIAAQNVDIAFSWVPGGYLFGCYSPDDPTYRQLIEAKIFRNHGRYGSIPEIQQTFLVAFGAHLSFTLVGPMEVDVTVPLGTSTYALGAITNFKNNERVDHRGLLPWPATLRIRNVIVAS